MEILYYRYGSICEPATIKCFEKMGITVLEDTAQITRKTVSPQEIVENVSDTLKKHHPLFVFSINYFPVLSKVCNLFQIPYVCWTVDAPVLELFSEALALPCNRVFLFDRAQYEYFSKRAPGNCFYLPLATDVSLWDQTTNSASLADLSKFTSDISFVGSLYTEKDPFAKIKGLSQHALGFADGLLAAQKAVYGYNFLEESLTPEIIEEFGKVVPDMYREDYHPSPSYVLAHTILGYHLAAIEREEILNLLGSTYNVSLYTRSDTSPLQGITNKGGAKTLTEMPLIFHQSKINLNMTIRPIQTGLPQRIFDICGCGGFLMTNYQSELPEYYELGKEVIAFTSLEELHELCGYFLTHEEERAKIAQAGYERTKNEHTYEKRITEMIRLVNTSI